MTTRQRPPTRGRIPRFEGRSQLTPGISLDMPATLANLLRPLQPLFKRVPTVRHGGRSHEPSDILLPDGYRAEVVTTGLNAPVHCTFDEAGACYVTESGHKVATPPRIVKVETATGETQTWYEFPKERWIETGAVTGAAWHEGALYVTNTDTLSRIHPDGRIEDLVTDLPGRGDHQVNHPVVGPDGKLYFGVGSATNAGVVGPDNAAYEWLARFPDAHDVPAFDVTLAGRNFESRNIAGSPTETVQTGAFLPYGTPSTPGQVIRGQAKANGILRCNADGAALEVVAWGLRNPYGLAFAPDGRLWATEHGMDSRSRHVVADFDDFYEIREGAWYGWPDFCSGVRLDDPRWGEGGQGREPVLAEFPDPEPPKPFASFEPHSAANGVAISPPHAGFGFEGDAFVALFGDLAPITTPRLMTPVGYKVARVDMETGEVVDFAVNRIVGPASKLPQGGFERPSHCEFGPDGALYVVDFGEIDLAPEVGGIRVQAGSGTLWRIVREHGIPRGDRPETVPRRVPFYAAQYLTWGLGALAAGVGSALLLRRFRRRGRER